MPTQIPVRTEQSWTAAARAVLILAMVASIVIGTIMFVIVRAYT